MLNVDEDWQAELLDMQYIKQNIKINYKLEVLDLFCKFTWATPIINKIGNDITKAFQSIFKG